MKKELKILIAIIVLGFCVIGTYFIIDFNNEPTTEQKETNNNTETESQNKLVLIDYETFLSKRENKENFILVVTQTGCGACDAYKPKFNEVLSEYKITAYELNIKTLENDNLREFGEEFPIEYTPTTLVFEEGEEQTDLTVVGNESKEKIIQTLKQYGYIK